MFFFCTTIFHFLELIFTFAWNLLAISESAILIAAAGSTPNLDMRVHSAQSFAPIYVLSIFDLASVHPLRCRNSGGERRGGGVREKSCMRASCVQFAFCKCKLFSFFSDFNETDFIQQNYEHFPKKPGKYVFISFC